MRGVFIVACLIGLAGVGPASCNSASAADALAGMRWTARPVVIFTDDPNDPRFKRQISALDGRAGALADYDVKVVRVTHADPTLRAKLGVAPRGFAVVLVGKDGDPKKTWTAPVDPSRIFALIDTMPMRRDEVKARD